MVVLPGAVPPERRPAPGRERGGEYGPPCSTRGMPPGMGAPPAPHMPAESGSPKTMPAAGAEKPLLQAESWRLIISPSSRDSCTASEIPATPSERNVGNAEEELVLVRSRQLPSTCRMPTLALLSHELAAMRGTSILPPHRSPDPPGTGKTEGRLPRSPWPGQAASATSICKVPLVITTHELGGRSSAPMVVVYLGLMLGPTLVGESGRGELMPPPPGATRPPAGIASLVPDQVGQLLVHVAVGATAMPVDPELAANAEPDTGAATADDRTAGAACTQLTYCFGSCC
mmetsp:Transcript_2152/g.4959  ORF Transcript_2152/g.4959 Transcript_2152/m.4959 type:complete len:287 (+) Transcript_2152:1221-2081(+)